MWKVTNVAKQNFFLISFSVEGVSLGEVCIARAHGSKFFAVQILGFFGITEVCGGPSQDWDSVVLGTILKYKECYCCRKLISK